MAVLPRKTCKGLTLIEVLIALAIISISLTAVIKASSQNIQSTSYLQDKTVALWVGQEIVGEVQAGLLTLAMNDVLNEKMSMLNKKWHWQASLHKTPNESIKKLSVKVSDRDLGEENNTSPLVTLESYLYKPDDKL